MFASVRSWEVAGCGSDADNTHRGTEYRGSQSAAWCPLTVREWVSPAPPPHLCTGHARAQRPENLRPRGTAALWQAPTLVAARRRIFGHGCAGHAREPEVVRNSGDVLNAALPEKAPPSRGGCGSGCMVAFPGDLRTVLVSRPGRGGWRAARVQRVCTAAAYLRHSRSVAAAARHPPLAGGCQALHRAAPRWSTRIARVTGRRASPGAEGVARARVHPLADCQRAQGHALATPQVRAAMGVPVPAPHPATSVNNVLRIFN